MGSLVVLCETSVKKIKTQSLSWFNHFLFLEKSDSGLEFATVQTLNFFPIVPVHVQIRVRFISVSHYAEKWIWQADLTHHSTAHASILSMCRTNQWTYIVVSDWNSYINMIHKQRRYVGHAGGHWEQHPQWPGHDSQEVIHYWFQSTLWLPDMILTWYWCVGNAWGLQVPHPEPPGRAGWNLIYLIRQDRINLNSC